MFPPPKKTKTKQNNNNNNKTYNQIFALIPPNVIELSIKILEYNILALFFLKTPPNLVKRSQRNVDYCKARHESDSSTFSTSMLVCVNTIDGTWREEIPDILYKIPHFSLTNEANRMGFSVRCGQ